MSLLNKYHPDSDTDGNSSNEEQFKLVADAYDILSNKEK